MRTREKYCSNCSGNMYMSAMSQDNCKICGTPVICGHLPCYEICKECSDELDKCIQCGKDLKSEEN